MDHTAKYVFLPGTVQPEVQPIVFVDLVSNPVNEFYSVPVKNTSALIEVQNVMPSRSLVSEPIKKKYRAILPKTSLSELQNQTKSEIIKKKAITSCPKQQAIAVHEKISPGSVNQFGRGMHCDGYNYCCKNKERTR